MTHCALRKLRPLLLLAALAGLSDACFGGDPPSLTLEVKPADPLLRYNGRFDWQDSDAPSASFPGSELVVHFSGTAIGARLSSTREDQIQVIIDNKPTAVLALSKEPALYIAGQDLPPGEHTVILFKRTEAAFGTIRFYGLQLPSAARLLPAPRPRRNIEFIGDSITCGYGDEAINAADKVTAANSNHYLSYASIAARQLLAEHVAVAVSGIRLTARPDAESMPATYLRIDPSREDSRWDFDRGPVPDIVVINLGTNDFRTGILSESEWVKSYLGFLDFVRSKRPHAQIFLTNGSIMGPGEKLDNLRQWNREVVSKRQAAGDTRIRVLDFEIQNPADGYGSDWHPSVKTHEKMAAQLAVAIQNAVNW